MKPPKLNPHVTVYLLAIIFVLIVRTDGLWSEGANSMHPRFSMLDETGAVVTDNRSIISMGITCGQCHDTNYINNHNIHYNENVKADCAACHFKGSKISADLSKAHLNIQLPSNRNCASCHGIIHDGSGPLAIPADYSKIFDYETGKKYYNITQHTGVVLSPQDLSESSLNIKDKKDRNFAWDIHTRRGLTCISCHYTRNDPRSAGFVKSSLDHLKRDPRRIQPPHHYLKWPDHRLESAECTDCHNRSKLHKNMPYEERHMNVLDCQACHVPELFGPAFTSVDHTVMTDDGNPGIQLRGIDEARSRPGSLNTQYFEGYQPFLFPYKSGDNKRTIAPFNLVTRWTWKSNKTGKEVSRDILKQIYLNGSQYADDVIKRFDTDLNNQIDAHELVLDTREKIGFIKARLAAAGVEEPVIEGTINAHKINHGVVNVKRMARNCSSCHSKSSRFAASVVLASRAPAGIIPEFQHVGVPSHSQFEIDGTITVNKTGAVLLKRTESPSGYYIFGYSRITALDSAGLWIFLLAVLVVILHGGMRYISSLKHPPVHVPTKEVYMYRFYERLWHWTMATGVLILAVTGLEIHYAGSFTLLGLETAVRLHNVLAAILVVNAVLSLFYHLVSGEIKQFFRFNRKFIREVLVQVYYYISGIFKRKPHPIGKTVERKLNPLQQLAYIGLLNVLLPFQVITGVLIWGVGQWPQLSERLGGLAYLGPIHNFAAWLFLTFLVVHIYLTTTGHTVTSNLKAMINGYDEIPEGEDRSEHTALTDMRVMDLAGTLIGKLARKKNKNEEPDNIKETDRADGNKVNEGNEIIERRKEDDK